MSDDPITLGEAWPYLLGCATLATGAAAALRQRDATRAALDGAQSRDGCATCRRECRRDVERLLLEHGGRLAEHATALEVLRVQLGAIRESSARVESTLERLADRLDARSDP